MPDIEPPDSHHLNAAIGWLELGLPRDAWEEIARLSTALRAHPETLAVEWELYARERRWPEALDVASRLQEADDARPTGWINRAFALHELRRTAEARDALLPAVGRFPALGVIPYNLACYACQLGQFEEARGWLRQAMKIDGRDVVISRARSDTDLRPLLGEIDQI
jgi:tetratricopeptide (TPR) repeat protein